jgi:hypothetical protein
VIQKLSLSVTVATLPHIAAHGSSSICTSVTHHVQLIMLPQNDCINAFS